MIALLLMGTTSLASAHVLKENHAISSVLHIPPDDVPEANKPTKLDFSFGDDDDSFGLPNCNCKVTVKDSTNKVIYSTLLQPALKGATLTSIVTVTFPTAGVYNVLVDGSAKDGKFEKFHLGFLVQVASSATSKTTQKASGAGSQIVVIGAGSLALLGMVAYNSISFGGRYAKKVAKPKSKKKTNKAI